MTSIAAHQGMEESNIATDETQSSVVAKSGSFLRQALLSLFSSSLLLLPSTSLLSFRIHLVAARCGSMTTKNYAVNT